MTTIITRRICLESKFLDSNILRHLLNKIIDLTKNECSKEYGFIIGIKRIISIDDSWISAASSENVFTITFEAITLKPEIGSVLEGNVCMIFPNGILLNIEDKMKFLVPLSSLSEYQLNKQEGFYFNEKRKISKNDRVSVSVVDVKYKNQTFMCFGNLV